MLSRKPYLLRAMHEWIVDSGHTPFIVVDTAIAGVEAPAGYAKEGKLVLNLSHTATHGLDLGNNQQLEFETRFGGVSRRVCVPWDALLAIYAQETGQGIVFGPEDQPAPAGPAPAKGGQPVKSAGAKKPSLKVVK
ncbi:MAG: ClpXP protease specificity-enhancing factor [Gammaproteobacteria bacterium]|nr:ClpXP protease specificity-enhancing factor [Gammaproteobacteria bacterium]MBU6510342.1 ClpXP protease specificity-enhancing factor [Gammaproteobacteria bacterium]MDE1984545.1 ClpXP protease specificity-enhancing factor [Gammaproteobacteria bacterium]MDE2109410.1 ClpXP protease specificity-enhancing factor [Gammaproteobacteria bacterium]MDE2460870.1 ClpXP protease specificity-enhancing factor [Gammaproteobacteria bacterium]